MIEQCPCCGSEIRKYRGTFIAGPNYTISQDNKSVTKYTGDGWNANAIGSEEITPGTITIINFKIENTTSNSYIMFGVAPKSINQNSLCYNSCGWYFYSNSGGLYCQPPLSYSNFNYRNEKLLPNGTIITVIVDTVSGKISFKVNDDKIKTAYHSITFNERIVPCVNLYSKGDAVRIIHE
jgi:hypothetical protein